MSSHHRPQPSSSSSSLRSPTYTSLATLRDQLRSTKITERRAASKQLLEKLQDSSTKLKLAREAEIQFDQHARRRAATASPHGTITRDAAAAVFPRERVSILYRGLLEAAIFASRKSIDGSSVSDTSTTRKRRMANQTGFTAHRVKFNAEDVMFPYRVFLQIDGPGLEWNDGVAFLGSGNSVMGCGSGSGSGRKGGESTGDWKSRLRYGHHLSTIHSEQSAFNASSSSFTSAQTFSATHYNSYDNYAQNTDQRTTHLSPKEVISCVSYIIDCLSDDDCCNFAQEQLLQWLSHICARPEYVVHLGVHVEVSYILHEVGWRLNRMFEDGDDGVSSGAGGLGGKNLLLSPTHARGGNGTGSSIHNNHSGKAPLTQACLLNAAKCLSALIYQLTTRLGIGMQLYIRPVIEMVAIWAENAWSYNHHASGGGTAVGDYTTSTVSNSANVHRKNKNSSNNTNDYFLSPVTHKTNTAILPPRRNLRSETDIAAMIPYLYSTVTNLLSSHPQHSIPILSQHGRALLRFAKKHYVKPTIVHPHLRDALTEYLSGHLMVAEMSGIMSGLLEGDLGPLAVEDSGDGSGVLDEMYANGRGENGIRIGEKLDNDDSANAEQSAVTRKRAMGATLDQKAINDLLDMIRSEKVWESIFPSHGGGAGAMGDEKKKRRGRRTLSGRSGSGGSTFDLSEGGGVWTPLNRRQRRHLELMSRLLRISQRLYLAEAEAAGDGTRDAMESLIEAAEERKRRSGVEQGEVDIEMDGQEGGDKSFTAEIDVHHTATLDALACSPFIRMISRHLYQLNPKLEKEESSANISLSQNSSVSAMQQSHSSLPTNPRIPKSGSSLRENNNEDASCEALLLKSCPMLQALLVEGVGDTSSKLLTFKSTQASSSSDILGASTTTKMLDSRRPTTIATLQFICACAEAFPRGECWSSSARRNWSTVLDERNYPGGTSARILERHGSSPADAASIVYLLGTTLESCGGSGGDESVQIWTLVALLKMVESCAIICSREGLMDSASFGSSSQLEVLRLAWQYVWNTLLRFDLRYSAYTSTCYQNNAGELVIQLLTQMIRYQCTDRRRLISLQMSSGRSMEIDTLPSTTTAPDAEFIQAEQGKIWVLPVFENTTSIFSGAPFELITSMMQFCTFSGSTTEINPSISAKNFARDRKWFVSFCLHFIEIAMSDTANSNIRRTFLPFVGTCLSALISDGWVISSVSTFELDSLSRFGVTEDAEPLHSKSQEQRDISGTYADILHVHDELWHESIAPTEYIFEMGFGLAKRVVQGREAFLSTFIDATFERESLRRFMELIQANRIGANIFSKNYYLADLAFERLKSLLEDALYQLRFDIDHGETQEENAELPQNDGKKEEILPFVTGYLTLVLGIILSKHFNVEDVAKNLEEISSELLIPSLESVIENIPSNSLPLPDFSAVLGHLHGILAVISNVFALRDAGSGIPRIYNDVLKSLFHSLQSCLKEYRQIEYTSASNNPLVTPTLNGHNQHGTGSDSEDDFAHVKSGSQVFSGNANENCNFMDDDFMDDDYDDGEHNRLTMQHAPPSKRRRVATSSRLAVIKKSYSIQSTTAKYIDSRCAWSCANLMVTLHPSMQCLETIASHLVWPEDFDDDDGYDPISRNPDPIGPLVCASIFCRKSVILRQHLLNSTSPSNQYHDVGQSVLILSLEIILQARRYASQSSKFFMGGFELISEFVKIVDFGGSDHSLSSEESELVVDSIYPEGCSQKNEDYRSLRQLKKKLKHRVFYRSEQQLRTAILVFLFAQSNLHSVFDGSFPEYFVKAALRHSDEHVRSCASDALGAVFTSFPSQEMIAAEITDKVLPPLSSSSKKLNRWIESLSDPKLSDDLSKLEQAALDDARLSYQYQAIECIGLIAGTSSDATVRKDMIWKLINLATKKPMLTLLCRRACERAAFLLGFRYLDDLLDDLAPHLLVKWVESRRGLCNLPILLTSPFVTKELCRCFPNEILRMITSEGGWCYDFWCMEEVEGGEGRENRLLDERVLPTFLHDVGPILIPVILVSSPLDDRSNTNGDKIFETTTYVREYVLTLTEGESDEQIAKILRFHIRDIFGLLFILQGDHDNSAMQDACHNASQYLRRCISDAHIEREGAKQAFLVLRRILMLHCKTFSIAWHGEMSLDPRLFIDGMKCVSRQLTNHSSDRHCAGFLEPAGSSLTECVVIVKYWLSKSLNAQQRENAGGTFSLLCIILQESIEDRAIQTHELRFCLHSFISIMLEPENSNICPSILESLKSVLKVLFSASSLESLAVDVTSTLHKISLSLMQVHKNAYLNFCQKCMTAFRCFLFNQKTSRGLLNGLDVTETVEFTMNEQSQQINLLKTIISTKSKIDERLLANTMIKSFECLEMIALCGKLSFEDILGAEDFSHLAGRHHDAFCNFNEKFSVESLHKIIPENPGGGQYDDIDAEYENFVRVMNDHPLSTDVFDFDSRRTVAQCIDSRARFLALRRLEKAIASNKDQNNSCPILPLPVYETLLLVCCSKDPEESRLVASRCLGAMKGVVQNPNPTSQSNEPCDHHENDMKEYFDNPLLAIQAKILSMLVQFLQSDCAETSLVAMKTSKALLATSDGKRSWKSLDEDVKGTLNSFVNANESSLRNDSISISNHSLLKLKDKSGVRNDTADDTWCWKEAIWTFYDEDNNSCSAWIKLVVCSIISCCYKADSTDGQSGGSPGFFRRCAGLCAKEASFAACVFPGVIYHLLESEDRDRVNGKSDSVRDIILAKTAIGSPTSKINADITKCFSLLLRTITREASTQNLRPVSPALSLVLNTLELLKSLTEHRFLTYPDHVKNISTIPKTASTKKRRSRNSDAASIEEGSNAPKWRGFPYGVVLRLDGFDIAKACYHAKRFYSAIYYAEMSMQNLIGVSNFFEEISRSARMNPQTTSVRDVSGFGVLAQTNEQENMQDILQSALLAKDIIISCLTEIQENNELEGVLAQASSMNLKQTITALISRHSHFHTQSIPKLLDLDIHLQMSLNNIGKGSKTDIMQDFTSITDCLEDIGLNHIKRHYLIGMETSLDQNREFEKSRQFLREKWFEDCLKNTSQWDDVLLPKENKPETSSPTIFPSWMTGDKFSRQHAPSFYESVYQSIESLVQNDMAGGCSHILEARKSVISDLGYIAGSESKLRILVDPMSKLSLLGNLEQLAKILEENTPSVVLLNQWGLCDDSGNIQRVGTLLLNNDLGSYHGKVRNQKSDALMFRLLETAVSVKEICLKILIKASPERRDIAHALICQVYKSCCLYIELGRHDLAKVSLSRMRSLLDSFRSSELGDDLPNTLPLILHLEDAKIMTCQNNLDTAITHCKMIVSHLKSDATGAVNQDNRQLLAKSLLLGGIWMTNQNVDSAKVILSSFFQKAAELALDIHDKTPTDSSIAQASAACFKLGEFAANLYSSLDARTTSETWKRRNIAVAERRKELEVCSGEVKILEKKARRSSDNIDAFNELWIHRETLKREVTMDERETRSVETSIKSYLFMAVKSYCSALKLSTPSTTGVSKHVFQLVSLWFKNCDKQETMTIVNEEIKLKSPTIPSYRFVPLIYQLFSRIDTTTDDDENSFQMILRRIVLRICSEHPYHGIVQLIALTNGKRVGSGVSGRHATAYLDNVGDAKVDAAKSVLQDLRKTGPNYVVALIGSYECLMDSYIDLAMYSTTKIQDKQTEGISFSKCKLDLDVCVSGGRRGNRNTSISNMPVIITQPPPVRPDAKYGDGKEDPVGSERVTGFNSTFDLTPSGIHRPKIVKCHGSKGTIFKQLVKGEDDIRQDAIMQQVFGTVNDLLRQEDSNGNEFRRKSTEACMFARCSRLLKLITYGITPLSPASGVLEWVENTIAFGDFLTDGKGRIGAHSKYYPGEWGSVACRKHYDNATAESKRQVFDEICNNFSPVFRFFFLEYFSSSMEAWYTARMLYTRSCAVNSIVGHILGIGDRHTQNILVHTKTGEIVHIDFGIVFEQGKALTTPETVPFRLTRDVVDGMGPCGTEGEFSKAAEATMSVLRSNADALLTILSAVVSDPLYKWNVSPVKARKRQRSNEQGESREQRKSDILGGLLPSTANENRNDSADRAIAKIHEKLQGYEEGTSGEHKTVAGQVKLLINEARDPNNLSVLFAGWTPWI